MPFSIKAFRKFRILFTKTFIMRSLKINHLLILPSVIFGCNDLPPIELTVGIFFLYIYVVFLVFVCCS